MRAQSILTHSCCLLLLGSGALLRCSSEPDEGDMAAVTSGDEEMSTMTGMDQGRDQGAPDEDQGSTSSPDMRQDAGGGEDIGDMGDMGAGGGGALRVLCEHSGSGMQRLVYTRFDPRTSEETPVDETLPYSFQWACDGEVRSLSGNGVPNHAVTGGVFATKVSAQQVTFAVPLAPEVRDATTAVRVAGFALNSVKFDPATAGTPLELSLDLTVQAAAEQVLAGGMSIMNAKGAASVLMDIHTGEIISMVSLPDFDPNNRPPVLTNGDQSDSPLFNRAVQGVYELGSVFKIFTVAQAMELGLVNPDTMIDTQGPLTWGRFRIRDFHDYGPRLSTTDVIVESSNIGTARIAMQIGAERQQEFLRNLGFLEPTQVEMIEAPTGRPLLPRNWSEISTMTISYGHGLSSSPLHLAAGYASLLNGGTLVRPTLLRQEDPVLGPRVVSEAVSARSRDMLRQVVTRGTASFGEVPGYEVGGKTGTADKPRAAGGGYYDDKVIATFASVFPANDPQYVLIVTLDEPSENSGSEPRRTAGWTAVPVAAEMIRRVAPLLGLRPQVDRPQQVGVTLTSN